MTPDAKQRREILAAQKREDERHNTAERKRLLSDKAEARTPLCNDCCERFSVSRLSPETVCPRCKSGDVEWF